MKTPKDIVVYIDTADVSVCRVYIDYAVSLARAWDAHVVVAFVPEDLIATPSHGFARGAAINSMITSFEARRHDAEEQLRGCPSSNDLRLFGLWKIGVSGSDFGLI